MSSLPVEIALGLCAFRGSRTIDVGAGRRDGTVVVADGFSGHSTGWVGARLAVRTLCERIGEGDPHYLGAALDVPDDWGWAGAMQSRSAGERVYGEVASGLGDPEALPQTTEELFVAIDAALQKIPKELRLSGQLVGCLAATVEGATVKGKHVGVGRALLLRAGTDTLESLTVQHYMHLVAQRSPKYRDLDPAVIPPNIVCNGLGGLSYSEVGIDSFEIELSPGDLLLLCSADLDIPDEDLAPLLRESLSQHLPLPELSTQIVERSQSRFDATTLHDAHDVAFAVLTLRQ